MKRVHLSSLLLTAMALLAACANTERSHDHSDASGGHSHASEGERPTVSITHWTERTELFMEHPVLVAGEKGRAAVHLTDLADFSPLNAGEAAIELRSADDWAFEFVGGPSRPGIYGIDVGVDEPGVYEMTLYVDAPGLKDRHELGPVTVHPADAEFDDADPQDHGEISFLKEQQWVLEFGTEAVQVRQFGASIRVPGSVRPRTGGEATLAAPVPGRINPVPSVPVPGTRVRAGTILASIVPRPDGANDAAGLQAALVEAEQQEQLADRERERAARLVESRAIPARRLSEAEAAVVASQARLRAARQRWALYEPASFPDSDALHVRSPFDGVVADVWFAPGASVEQAEKLVRLVDTDRVHVVAVVPESRASMLTSVRGGELLRDGQAPISLGQPHAIGKVIDPDARTVEVRFAMDNRELGLHVGRSVGVRLFLADTEAWPAVPESAVIDDGGAPVVFVQTSGESFARRPVTLGNRAGGYVHVLAGVASGEHVVGRGAYLIRLATLSTQAPSHGHVH